MMDDGIIDLPGIRRAVENAGYRGYAGVEIFSANIGDQARRRGAANMHRAI